MSMIISRKYEVLSQLGKGGMGVVYKVRHVTLDTILALKVLPRDLMATPELLARFYREARMMARLRHPNIIRVLDIDHDAELEFHYFVMEYIQGKTLRAHLQERGPLPLPEVLMIAAQAARALVSAHAQTPPIIHRDIKPSNIMIEDGSSRVVVMDFGVAKELDDGEMTRSGVVLGSLRYCPPEQLRNEPLDGTADVYALGMVMYEAYTGGHLFAGVDEAGVIGKVLYESGEPELHFTRPTSPLFTALVKKAIAKSRERRYQPMEELLSDIEACFASLNVANPLPVVLPTPPEIAGLAALEVTDERYRSLDTERQPQLIATPSARAEDDRSQALTIDNTAVVTQARDGEETSGSWSEIPGWRPRERSSVAQELQYEIPHHSNEDHWEIGEGNDPLERKPLPQPTAAPANKIPLLGIGLVGALLLAGWIGWTLLQPPPAPLPEVASPPPTPAQSQPPPLPALTLSQSEPRGERVRLAEGKAVTFAVSASGAEPFAYEWTLDGELVSQERRWTYQAPQGEKANRTKIVRVQVSDQHGQSVEKSWRVTLPAANQPPRLITVTPPPATIALASGAGQTFTLEAEDPEHEKLEYEWTVDGKRAGGQSTFTWSAAGEGRHQVQVVVKDQAGLSVAQEWQVVVAAAPPTPPKNVAPHIAQAFPVERVVSLREKEVLEFSALALDADGEEVAYQWSVDGQRVAQGNRFSYSADAAGNRHVTLTVEDQGGLSDSFEWEVHITAPPTPPRVVMYTPHQARVRLFAHQSRFFGVEVEAAGPLEPPIQYAWTIDGRLVARQAVLEVKNQSPGRHEVEVTATSPAGASVSHRWVVDVVEQQDIDEPGIGRPPQLAMLELDNEVSADKKQVVVTGKLRNIGRRDAENVIVWVSALDAQRKSVFRRLALPSPQPLGPGQTASFALAFANRSEISDFHVEIVSK